MKPAKFAYERPRTVEAVVALLAQAENAKILAGGQTLGPMLNLRLAQPDLIIDITRIGELARLDADADTVTLGACVTHSAVEDGRASDFSGGFLPKVAGAIAYRAVRNRGTLGGSIAHADPSADWPSCFMALGATVLIAGARGVRETPIADFVRGALDCDLAADEMITAIRLPRLSAKARCGFAKICRKEGEFADAIGVYVFDPERGIERLVAGAVGGKPLVADAAGLAAGVDLAAMTGILQRCGYAGDHYDTQIHGVALQRAVGEAFAA
jgi:carbon-monoxide dehydrogenase medium subunit